MAASTAQTAPVPSAAPGISGFPVTPSTRLARAFGLLPGVVLALALAVPAKLLEGMVPLLPAVVVAMVLGIVIANAWSLPKRFQAGARFCVRYLLRSAIVLLGAGLSFQAVLATGALALAVVLVCVITAFALAWVLARGFRLHPRISLLIGAGTAICGASAIVACSPLVEATEDETAYAIATIFAFNLVALVVYPLVGAALGLSGTGFGVWAGTAVNDTAASVATGYAYGNAAGATATVVKLTRTVLLVPLAVALGVWGARLVRAASGGTDSVRGGLRGGRAAGGDHAVSVTRDADATTRRTSPLVAAAKTVPWFVLGFLALAAINTAGLISPAGSRLATEVAKFLIVMVLAGVGLGTSLRTMRRMGGRPLALGFGVATVMAVVSLTLVYVTGLAALV